MVHAQAIEQTKKKLLEDIDRFVEVKTSLPSLEHYKKERQHYYEQLWLNVWLNKATNSIPRKEKKGFLKDRGYIVEGIDRKIINKLFRNELRTYKPFHVERWLNHFSTNNQWNHIYEKAKAAYHIRQKEEQEANRKRMILHEIQKAYDQVIESDKALFYMVRHEVSKKVEADLAKRQNHLFSNTYQKDEQIEEVSQSINFSTFLQNLSNDTTEYNHAWQYETMFDQYNQFIDGLLEERLLNDVLTQLPNYVSEQYFTLFGKELTHLRIRDILKESMVAIRTKYVQQFQKELLPHLARLANLPFDLSIHQQIFEHDKKEQELFKLEEKKHREKEIEKEARMIDDIFGREYRLHAGRNIRYVLHIGETNTGKTHYALEKMKKSASGIYLAPLRLLALEVYDKLNKEGVSCSLKTGEEEKIIEGATHFSSTVEMFYEKEFFEVIVIDESQMIADKDRGFSWYKAITKANANEVHIIGSRNAQSMILELLGDSDIEIREYSRDIPLQVESKEFSLKQSTKGDALVCFSRKRVLETASQLQKNGHQVSMIYGSMPPETRKKQMQRFIDGETTMIVATDAIGMGLNLPIRRIVFLENEKFDGTRRRRLTSQEIKQIAGRAGRKGIYNIGKVAFVSEINLMRRLLEQEDEPIYTFAIAPTNSVFERFQKYYRDLGTFFDLWDRFESPKGTKKASLTEEKELYESIRDTEIEGRLPMMDLYGFLHLPFSTREPELIKQWQENLMAVVNGKELPEPTLKRGTLEELELSYKAIGLHLLFLYRLGRRTEAMYWERLRGELSDRVHDYLRYDSKNLKKACKFCGKSLSWEFAYTMCNSCHKKKYVRNSRFS